MEEKNYNDMTLEELQAEKRKTENKISALKDTQREIAKVIGLKLVKAEFDAMPDAKKESLRQVIGK
jgi:hypothetical protein